MNTIDLSNCGIDVNDFLGNAARATLYREAILREMEFLHPVGGDSFPALSCHTSDGSGNSDV